MSSTNSVVFANLGYQDARAAIRFLIAAFGFEEIAVYDVGDSIGHAELRWPGGGKIMLHSAEAGCSIADITARSADRHGYPGFSVHTDTNEPETLFERAVAAGARVIRPVEQSPFGTRGFVVADPEGLYWSFGTKLPKLLRDREGRWRPEL
jgi:uncharacterized glyoxalase superfamily protein PhnB